MKAFLLSLAAGLLTVSSAAYAEDKPAYSLTVFLDEDGNEIGYFLTYCDGTVETSGQTSNRYYTNYGNCTLQ